MQFQPGDPVMHWMYGFGHVVGLEERVVSGRKAEYYAISVRDLTVWVPSDDRLPSRLRIPTTKAGFRHLFKILNGTGDPLPVDRQERKLYLLDMLKDGKADSLCRALRDLASFQQSHTVNYNDENIMKRLRDALLGEWSFALSVPVPEADADLRRMLGRPLSA